MLLRKRDREREVREGITMRKVPVKHVMDRERTKERGIARERKRERQREKQKRDRGFKPERISEIDANVWPTN